MEDWEAVRDRLKDAVSGVTSDEYFVEVQPADIRAALERVEHLELEGKLREVDRMDETARASAAEAKLARVVAALEALLPPEAEEYRTAEGDNVTLDRYWVGWVGAVDQALAAAKGE